MRAFSLGFVLRTFSCISTRQTSTKICGLFSSTKKNKRIIEKKSSQSNLGKAFDPEKNNINKPEIKELSSKESLPKFEDLIKDIKTKRYIYNEKNAQMTVLDKTPNLLVQEPEKEKKNLVPQKEPEKTERLSKYLSRAGICSRREAERLIQRGMVFVDKKRVDSNVAVTDKSNIKIFTKNGSTIPLKENSRLWMFYKPRGLVCSVNDPDGRPSVYDYLKQKTKFNLQHFSCVVFRKFECFCIFLV